MEPYTNPIDMSNLVQQMKRMDVLDKDTMALVPAGTFSRSLWHAAALSSELNRLLRIQERVYNRYSFKETCTKSAGDTKVQEVGVGENVEKSIMALPSSVVLSTRRPRRRRLGLNKVESSGSPPAETMTSEIPCKFRSSAKRAYPMDEEDESYEDVNYGITYPQKRRFHMPVEELDESVRAHNRQRRLSYCRINGKPIYDDSQSKSAEIQTYLLKLVNEDRHHQIQEIQNSTGHKVDSKILETEQFADACKAELNIAFAIIRGLRKIQSEGRSGEYFCSDTLQRILHKSGVSFDAQAVFWTNVHSAVGSTCPGTTIQEFPDD